MVGFETGEDGLKSNSEQKGSEGVALLDPGLRPNLPATKQQAGWVGVTPFNPRSQGWEVNAALLEKSYPVDSVKGVLEIDLQKHFVRVACISLAPLSRSVYASFRTKRLRDSDLQGK